MDKETRKRLGDLAGRYRTYVEVINELIDFKEKHGKGKENKGKQISVSEDTYKEFKKFGGNARNDEQRLLKILATLEYQREHPPVTLEEMERLLEDLKRR